MIKIRNSKMNSKCFICGSYDNVKTMSIGNDDNCLVATICFKCGNELTDKILEKFNDNEFDDGK